MAGKRRRLIVVLLVLVGLIVIVSVALRLILTRERLLAMVIPRIEKAVDAKISIGDIGIRFPFGFGVDVGDLAFEKPLPDGSNVSFTSSEVVVRASLISLIRRTPEISKVEVKGGSADVLNPAAGLDIQVRGLGVGMSVKPAEDGYRINSAVVIDSVSFSKIGGHGAVTLEKLRFEGKMESDAEFDSLRLLESTLTWNKLMAVRVSGEANGLKTERNISILVESFDNPVAPLLDHVMSLRLDAVIPALEGKELDTLLPVKISKGTLGFDSKIEGSMLSPADMGLSGTLRLNDLVVRGEALDKPFELNGDIAFSELGAGAQGFSVVFGRSKADIDFSIAMSRERKPESVGFKSDLGLDLEDLVSSLKLEGVSVTGTVRANVEGKGTPVELSGLFPAEGKPTSPETIAHSWKRVTIAGGVEARGVGVSAEGSPLVVSSLEAGAVIERGDINDLKAEFLLGGSPYSCQASLKQIMPAMAELSMLVRGGAPPGSLGKILDSIENVPDLSLELKGRSMDLRPFEKLQSGKKGGKDLGKAGESAKGDADLKDVPVDPFLANPLVPLFLKNTAFTVGLDSIIASKAVFTGVSAKGSIRNGRMKADPVSLSYAGGRGRATAEVDLRRPERIETRVDLAFEGIEAGRALGGVHNLGNLVEGRFTFRANGKMTSGPEINPLMTLNASGSALSSSGMINAAHFINPLSSATGLDLSKVEKFEFKEWSGSFLVDKGRFITDNWRVRSRNGDWAIRGSFGFDGTLDYAVNLVVPPQVQKEMKDLDKYRDLVDLLRDREGNLVLDFGIGGTAKVPKVSMDLSGAKKRAGEKVLDSLKKKAKDWFKK